MNNMEKNDCVFCKIIAGVIKADKIADYEDFIVINDAHPVSEGHCLIIPKRHFSTLLDLPSTLGSELLKIAKDQSLRLIKEGKAKGIKLGQNNFKEAGQAVMHFHLHVIPFKEYSEKLWKKADNA
jgi:histidine triad (HIT) family protein